MKLTFLEDNAVLENQPQLQVAFLLEKKSVSSGIYIRFALRYIAIHHSAEAYLV